MNYAPIVLFVYNRVDHFLKTYEALSKCEEAKYSDLFIFSDGAKNEKNTEKVLEVRETLHNAEKGHNFNSLTIVESRENRGLANSIISGVSQVISQYGTAIVVEDDCVASPYFLRYMNNALDYYKNIQSIGSVAGYTPIFDFPEDYKDDVFITYRSCSWGWATWKDRWETVDWTESVIKPYYKNIALIRKLNSCGNDRFLRLYRQTKGNSSSWSVRFGANLVLKNQYTVYPRYSYISNIGCDETGIHSKSEDAVKLRVDLNKAKANPQFTDVEYIPKIQKKMKAVYSGGTLSDIKRFAATTAIVLKKRIKGK